MGSSSVHIIIISSYHHHHHSSAGSEGKCDKHQFISSQIRRTSSRSRSGVNATRSGDQNPTPESDEAPHCRPPISSCAGEDELMTTVQAEESEVERFNGE